VHTQQTSPAKSLARERVQGVWIAIPTPFTADGARVDEEALEASVEHYVDALRVDGIFCGGVMGEFWALTLRRGSESTSSLPIRRPDGFR
jgi:hypothetical protein